MRIFISCFFICVCVLARAQQAFDYPKDFKNILSKTKNTNDALSYDKLLKRFNANDSAMTDYDVLALMIGFTDKPAYKPYNDLSVEREIYRLNADGNFKGARDTAKKFLAAHPVSQQALIELSFAYFKLGKQDSADIFMYRFRRIMNAMAFSGDGKEKPFFALGPADGQNFIRKYLSASIGSMGSGRDKAGNFIDILEAKYKNGKSEQLSFVIEHAMKKMFGGKSIEEELRELEQKKK